MQECINETDRRRSIQIAYNQEHGITPQTIGKKMQPGLREIYGLATDDGHKPRAAVDDLLSENKVKSVAELEKLIKKKTKEMQKFAADLDFEKAAEVRDTIAALKDKLLAFMDQTGAE